MKICFWRRSPLPIVTLLSAATVIAIALCILFPPEPHVAQAACTNTLGGPLCNITSLEILMFNQGDFPFGKMWDATQGLGPVFTQNGCQVCHAVPVKGGSSNLSATLFGTLNSDGSFNPLTNEGGSLLQTQSIGEFQTNCLALPEIIPSDATIITRHQSPAVFGMGLIDQIPDSSILLQAVSKPFGVKGNANMVPDENGTVRVGHFGLKAQVPDLLFITALALQHDIGVTNPLSGTEDLPQGKAIPPHCQSIGEPNDDGTQMLAIYHYVNYLAPITPGTGNSNGQALFTSVGCAECHLPSYLTQSKVIIPEFWEGATVESKAMENQTVNLYSELLLHDMGASDGDQIPAGLPTGTQWRTASLR